jgi:hypothetical protein
MKPLAPGTVIFHRHRGYGVVTTVNLLTGWVSARFGSEKRILDLCLLHDDIAHADGEPIRFRQHAPDRTPHARLMALVRELHSVGYQRLYLASWPKPSGLHWHWHLFTGPRNWLQRPLREGWYGSGAEYIFNPVLGWGDAPGADTEELCQALSEFDAQGLTQAAGIDQDHSAWFADVCDALLPDYMFSLERRAGSEQMAIVPVRQGVPPYSGPPLPWPPGWASLWRQAVYPLPQRGLQLPGVEFGTISDEAENGVGINEK